MLNTSKILSKEKSRLLTIFKGTVQCVGPMSLALQVGYFEAREGLRRYVRCMVQLHRSVLFVLSFTEIVVEVVQTARSKARLVACAG